MGKASKKRAAGSKRTAANTHTMPNPIAAPDSRWGISLDTRKQPPYAPRHQKQCLINQFNSIYQSIETKAMFLAEYYPGVTVERVQENTGFALDCSAACEATPPNERELRILREEVDPKRLILK
jgi:glutaconate CoA-transferase subunit B